MGTIAAAGMGVDTPPESPMQFPVFDEKHYADDEDFEEHVDTSFDDVPAANEPCDSSEDLDGDDAGRVRGVLRETVKQVVLGTSAMGTGDAEALEEFEFRTVQETAVFRECSHPSDEEQKGEASDCEEHDKLMAVAVSGSSVVVDPSPSTNESRDADGGKAVVSEDPDSGFHGEEGEEALSTTSEPVEHPECTKEATDMTLEEDMVGETPPSADMAHEADDGKDTSDERQGEQQQTESVPPPPDSPPPGAVNDTEKLATESEAPRVAKTATTRKRKLACSSPSGGDASPAKTVAKPPVHTPKQAALKKRKKSPHLLHSGGVSGDESPRRSSRVKNAPPKFTYPVQHLSDETVMQHFDRNAASAMTCHFCGTKVAASRNSGKRHLNACSRYSTPTQLGQKAGVASEARPAHVSSPWVKQVVKSEDSAVRSTLTLVKLMGSDELAAKLKQSIGALFTGHAPIDRFREMLEDDVVGLRHLRVQSLLDAVDPFDGRVVQLHPLVPGVQRSTGHQAVSASAAKARDLEKCALRFSAPRAVGDELILPLAKELGLGYALKKHRAEVVSCPQAGTVLDWQFRKTETVVFQLRGKALWKVKRSQVQHPVRSFHPQSWAFDAVASAAKPHRIASMDRGAVGFLAPPGEDVDAFDEALGDVGTAQEEEFLLQPGSVAYVPAGAWFEAETHGADVLWLEVELASTSCEELVFSALRQLAWGDEHWRMPVRIYPGDRAQVEKMQRHVDARVKSLGFALEASDLLPEYFVTDELQALVADGLVVDNSASADVRSFQVDLTNPSWKLERSKVYCDARYRVNPVAVLMSENEIPHLPAQEEREHAGHAASSTKPHRVLKKALKPSPKRKPALRAISDASKHTYVLDEAFGNDKLQSQLHVKFQCSGEQSKMVEWLRFRDSEPFDLKVFIEGQSASPQSKKSARYEKEARRLLRFLHFVGYVTKVKSP